MGNKKGYFSEIRTMEEKMFFYCVVNEYLLTIRNCTSTDLCDLAIRIQTIETRLLKDLGKKHKVSDRAAEAYLVNSPDYSKKFKVVVSRDGNGSDPNHYKIHSPLLPMDTDDGCIKNLFCGWEEFLTDEDGKLADQNLRDVTVREVRLGKIVAKLEPVQEVVYKVVKK
jgi:hypothetical protein